MRRWPMLFLPLAVMACALPALPECPPDAPPALWVADRGWHVELGVPASRLQGRAALLRASAPTAPNLLLGYGKRHFMVTPQRALPEYLLAPLPGAAVIEVLPALPPGEESDLVIALPLPLPGALARFLAESVEPDSAPQLGMTARGSAFHDASRTYHLLNTCNTWVASALQAGGLPVQPLGVVFADMVMWQAARVPGACRPVRTTGFSPVAAGPR